MKAKFIIALLVLLVWNILANDDVPVAISPGNNAGIGAVETRCPTFSWSGVAWAQKYQVVVFEVMAAGAKPNSEIELTSKPVLAEYIAGGGLSWTPSVSQGLAAGAEYAWRVGAMDYGGSWNWSAIQRFRVEGGIRQEVSNDDQAGLKEEKDMDNTSAEASSNEASALSAKTASGEKGSLINRMNALGTEIGSNTLYGQFAGTSITTGDDNTFLGYYAGNLNSSAYSNTFIGSFAGSSTTIGYKNTFIGFKAGTVNTAGVNTFIGNEAGSSNTTGNNNTFIGNEAGTLNTEGWKNVYIGATSGHNNTTGGENTFVGYATGYYNTGTGNTFLGCSSGRNNTIGSSNIFIGFNAGYNETGSDKLHLDNSITSSPLIYGDFATDFLKVNGSFQVTGTSILDNNTAVNGNLSVSGSASAGNLSLDNGTTLINAAEINILDGKTLATGAAGNNMLVTKGYVDENDDVGGGGLTGNEMSDEYLCKWDDVNTRLVNSLLSETSGAVKINGKLGIGVTTPSYPLQMASGAYCSAGGVWINASSFALKENIIPLTRDEAARTMQSLNPVKFNYKTDASESHVGFIAEEVPDLVAMKDRKSLSPMDIVAVLTKVVQEQQQTLKELKDEIERLKRKSKK